MDTESRSGATTESVHIEGVCKLTELIKLKNKMYWAKMINSHVSVLTGCWYKVGLYQAKASRKLRLRGWPQNVTSFSTISFYKINAQTDIEPSPQIFVPCRQNNNL